MDLRIVIEIKVRKTDLGGFINFDEDHCWVQSSDLMKTSNGETLVDTTSILMSTTFGVLTSDLMKTNGEETFVDSSILVKTNVTETLSDSLILMKTSTGDTSEGILGV